MAAPRLTLVSSNPREARDQNAAEKPADAEGWSADGAAAPSYSDPESAVDRLGERQQREKLRRLEGALFAAGEPLDLADLARCAEPGDDVEALLAELQAEYRDRGIVLTKVAGKWQFRTPDDLSFLLQRQRKEERKLSKAALETLAIIAYHQPVTRPEIEEIRAVSTSPGTLDVLMETGWIRPRGRRRAPGRPLTFGTTEQFLVHFGLEALRDLPGLSDLKAAGLLDGNLPPGFTIPEPTDVAKLMPDELPLTDDGEEEAADEDASPEPDLHDEDGASMPDA